MHHELPPNSEILSETLVVWDSHGFLKGFECRNRRFKEVLRRENQGLKVYPVDRS